MENRLIFRRSVVGVLGKSGFVKLRLMELDMRIKRLNTGGIFGEAISIKFVDKGR